MINGFTFHYYPWGSVQIRVLLLPLLFTRCRCAKPSGQFPANVWRKTNRILLPYPDKPWLCSRNCEYWRAVPNGYLLVVVTLHSPIARSTLNVAIRALEIDVRDFVTHDFRRTASMYLYEAGSVCRSAERNAAMVDGLRRQSNSRRTRQDNHRPFWKDLPICCMKYVTASYEKRSGSYSTIRQIGLIFCIVISVFIPTSFILCRNSRNKFCKHSWMLAFGIPISCVSCSNILMFIKFKYENTA